MPSATMSLNTYNTEFAPKASDCCETKASERRGVAEKWVGEADCV